MKDLEKLRLLIQKGSPK